MTELKSLVSQLGNPFLSLSQQAEIRCRIAKRLEEKGDYEGAADALGAFWRGLGRRSPEAASLDARAQAEILLRVGTLTGWIGQANQVESDAQESAKNLITEACNIFESLEDEESVLEARTEIACCYWREGGYDEARVILKSVIERLTDDSELKARAVLRIVIVECSSLSYSDALRILTEHAPLFEKTKNHTIRGGYHNALAGVYGDLGAFERREDYTDRAFVEYEAANYHYEQAGHRRYRANVENNLAVLYLRVGKYEEAHRHLDRARRQLARLQDKGTVAQMNETRALIHLAQGRDVEAEKAARAAVRTLEKSGRQSLHAEALTTYGTVLARLCQPERALETLLQAAEIARVSGALNVAGLASLTIIEELHENLSPAEMQAEYLRAYEWLSASQHRQSVRRLLEASLKVVRATRSFQEKRAGTETDTKTTLRGSVRLYEKQIIREALRKADGKITKAARLLGTSYQALSRAIESRHPELLKERTPIKPRKRRAN